MKKQTIWIIIDCSEDCGAGSQVSMNPHVFGDDYRMIDFIKNWNKKNAQLEKSITEQNKYFGSGNWCYWLDVRKSILN